jgi:thioredoxin reductase
VAVYDVIIVGAGPAGLSAALILGRCRRRVLVCDAGRPRNASSRELHGFLTRDRTPPAELLAIAREQLKAYPGVELRRGEVVDAGREGSAFEVVLADGTRLAARKLVLATGVVDELPPIPGAEALYGRGVFHCPYCDGWEVRDLPLAAYGKGDSALPLTRTLLGFSRDLVLCTDGPAGLSAEERAFLARHHVGLREERVVRLEGDGDSLRRIVFERGDPLPRRALFFHTGQYQRSALASKLGCEFNRRGSVETNPLQMTCVGGVYAAGDSARDVQLAIVAAAEGAKAAFAIHQALQEEDFA